MGIITNYQFFSLDLSQDYIFQKLMANWSELVLHSTVTVRIVKKVVTP